MASLDLSLDDLRLGDLRTFLAVARLGSVTAAARELRVTASHVSKAVARLEGQLGRRLLVRSSRGVSLSDDGRRLLPELEDVSARLRRLKRPGGERALELTVAAASYLIVAGLPRLAAAAPGLRVRGLELPPALVRAYAADNLFDLAVMGQQTGAERLPASWTVEPAGLVRKGLFAAPTTAAALMRGVSGDVPVERLRGVPFVCPVYTANGRFMVADDDCPLAMAERRLGHEVQTIVAGLELAAHTDHVIFGPVLAVRRHLEAGRLVEVPVAGWHVEEPMACAVNTDRVLAKVRNAVLGALRTLLAEDGGRSVTPPTPKRPRRGPWRS